MQFLAYVYKVDWNVGVDVLPISMNVRGAHLNHQVCFSKTKSGMSFVGCLYKRGFYGHAHFRIAVPTEN